VSRTSTRHRLENDHRRRLGTTRSINCVGNVPHQWRIQVYMLIDGVPGDPNPGYSDIYTLPCE
jgi:hypothetical protein